KAAREELSGSTITISSLGPMGGVTSTPVINRPEVAILAVNKVEEKVVVIDGEIEVRKRMNLSLSCDHRVVDGWDAASFMHALKGYIENPLRLLSAEEAASYPMSVLRGKRMFWESRGNGQVDAHQNQHESYKGGPSHTTPHLYPGLA